MQQQQTLEEIRAMDDGPTIILTLIYIYNCNLFVVSLFSSPYDNKH